MARIAHSSDRYLATPQLREQGDEVILSMRAWERVDEFQLELKLDADGLCKGEHARRPLLALDAHCERVASHGDEQVVAVNSEGIASIFLQRAGAEILVFRALAIATAPALFETSEGTWVAFHHNLREDTHTQDLAKWIAIRFVDREGHVLEPVAAMLGRDRDASGTEQSFEFPSLSVGQGGALALVGRGSHNIWRQDLDHEGYTPRRSLTDGSWGARGRRASLLCRGEKLLIAYRGRLGIEVVLEAAPQGRAPELRPAQIEYCGSQAPKARSWNRRQDPARDHGLQTFFGDIQQHSAHSDGLGSADEAYWRARFVYGDDFVALTDHESFLGKRTSPSEWEFLQDVADSHQAPGTFATLLAYEWTGKMHPGPGHKCVYLPRRGLPIISRDELPSGGELVQRIKEQGGIASPHHIGWSGCDESGHDELGQPVWEICSSHGAYEDADSPLGYRGDCLDQFAAVMLRRGHRFGFTAASDSHGLLWHHGECRKRDSYRTGLTAVQAPSLDRESIFDALRKRRCYATSGAKILLDFCAGTFPMGSVVPGPGPLQIHARVIGESALAKVELVTEEGVAALGEVSGKRCTLQTSLEARYCYLRVTQVDDEMAWSSPIWLDAQ